MKAQFTVIGHACAIKVTRKKQRRNLKNGINFISKYFELPNNIILKTFWNVGVYDLEKHEWVEKFDDFETLIHY